MVYVSLEVRKRKIFNRENYIWKKPLKFNVAEEKGWLTAILNKLFKLAAYLMALLSEIIRDSE